MPNKTNGPFRRRKYNIFHNVQEAHKINSLRNSLLIKSQANR